MAGNILNTLVAPLKNMRLAQMTQAPSIVMSVQEAAQNESNNLMSIYKEKRDNSTNNLLSIRK